jgi:hypothetical protein
VESIVDSISNIARGSIGAAIDYVERTLARTLPVIISFLARFIGLGNISGTVRGIIEKIQNTVSTAIDKVIAWVIDKAKTLLARATGSRPADPAAAAGSAEATSEPAAVGHESHTITARVQGDEVVFVMASVTLEDMEAKIRERVVALEKEYVPHYISLNQKERAELLRTRLRGLPAQIAVEIRRIRADSKRDKARRPTIMRDGVVKLSAMLGAVAKEFDIPAWYGKRTGGLHHDETWIGSGRPLSSAVNQAFAQIQRFCGVTREQMTVARRSAMRDRFGKSTPWPVEWSGPRGANVSIDWRHKPDDPQKPWETAPDVPHVGWYSAIVIFEGGRQDQYRGHILLDPGTVDYWRP